MFSFLLKPKDFKLSNVSNRTKIRVAITLAIFDLLLSTVVGVLVYFLQHLELVKLPSNAVEEWIKTHGFLLAVFGVAILGPFVEEVLFRAFISFRRCYPILFWIDLKEAGGRSRFVAIKQAWVFWERIFPLLVYLLIAGFGFVHLSNFSDDMPLWLSVIVVIPQIIGGAVLTYLRIRYGLVWSWLAHGTHNFILLVVYHLFFVS